MGASPRLFSFLEKRAVSCCLILLCWLPELDRGLAGSYQSWQASSQRPSPFSVEYGALRISSELEWRRLVNVRAFLPPPNSSILLTPNLPDCVGSISWLLSQRQGSFEGGGSKDSQVHFLKEGQRKSSSPARHTSRSRPRGSGK